MTWLSRFIHRPASSLRRQLDEIDTQLDALVRRRHAEAEATVREERARRAAIDRATGHFVYDAMRGHGLRPSLPGDPRGGE